MTDQHVIILARLLVATSVFCALGSVVATVLYARGSAHKLTGVKLACIGLACGLTSCVVAGWA